MNEVGQQSQQASSNLVSRIDRLVSKLLDWTERDHVALRRSAASLLRDAQAEIACRYPDETRPQQRGMCDRCGREGVVGALHVVRCGGVFRLAEEVTASIDGFTLDGLIANGERRGYFVTAETSAVLRALRELRAGRQIMRSNMSGPDHPRQYAVMDFRALAGTCVRYMDCNGYPGDVAHCRSAGLIKDQIYEVVDTDVYSSSSTVRLKGFDDWKFNTVCFCSVE